MSVNSPIDEDDQQETPHAASPHGWKIIFIFLGAVVLLVTALTLMYREMPKKSGIVERRKTPATAGVFTAVISPIDSVQAAEIAGRIAASIGADSSMTQMVVGGTHNYKLCTSLADYQTILQSAMINARPEDLDTQSKLLAQVVSRLMTDHMPSTFYLVGDFEPADFSTIAYRVSGAANVMRLRAAMSDQYGNVSMEAFPDKQYSGSAERETVRTQVFDTFRAQGIDVKVH